MYKTNIFSHASKVVKAVTGISAAMMALSATTAFGHGYTDVPKARQQYCVDDGGYFWPEDGSAVPNLGCRAGFLESGIKPFIQNIEFSSNVANYGSIDAVKAVVTDGLLCAGGDPEKRGMDIPSPEWQKAPVVLDANGKYEVLFYGATPHNPSFWEFYLTKPTFNPDTDVLTWDDLVRIDTAGDVATQDIGGRNMYRILVNNMPSDRTGDAIFFTRWQRNDVAGEGFYNCSDISFDTDPVVWHDAGRYIPQGMNPEVGRSVLTRAFDGTGQELAREELTVSSTNSTPELWAKDLADQWALGTIVQIGVKDANDNIVYNAQDLAINRVWMTQANHTFQISLGGPPVNQPPSTDLAAIHQVPAGTDIDITVTATDPEGDPLTYEWILPAGLSSTNGLTSPTVSVHQDTPPTATTDFTVQVKVGDGLPQNVVTRTTTLSVTVGCVVTDPDAANHTPWSAATTYFAGDTVSHNSLVWTSNFWNENVEPSQIGDTWTLTSLVVLPWLNGADYQKDEQVDHAGRRWNAKWWTNGEPGVDNAWEDIGVADCL